MRGSSPVAWCRRLECADRPRVDYGIADYDVFYFDPDLSWQAEDAVIRRLQETFAASGVTVERATRRGSISGIRKSMACPTRR